MQGGKSGLADFLSKHIKDSKESLFIMTQAHNLKFRGGGVGGGGNSLRQATKRHLNNS